MTQGADSEKRLRTSSEGGSVSTGDVSGSVVGRDFKIEGDFNFNVGADNTVLRVVRLDYVTEVDASIQEPGDKLLPIQKSLETSRFVILEAAPMWGVEYVANALAKSVIKHQQLNDSIVVQDEKKAYFVYAPNGSIAGSALHFEILQRKDIKNSLILIPNATRDQYPVNVLRDLKATAAERNLFIVLMTQPGRWGKRQDEESFFQLDEEAAHSPYTDDDLGAWLTNLLSLPQNNFVQAVFDTGTRQGKITQEMRFAGTKSSLSVLDVAKKLKAPGLIVDFPERLEKQLKNLEQASAAQGSEPAEKLQSSEIVARLVDEMVKNHDTRLQEWFNGLSEDSHYVVLALTLVGDLPQETFWAIYEQLTSQWRERQIALNMSDYQSIRVELEEYVVIETEGLVDERTRIRFRTSAVRLKLIEYVSQGYRRSLVQALPILGDIITEANRQGTGQSGSLVGRLRDLDILGSELIGASESLERQMLLRSSLISSIVQIQHYEPVTTEHLLVSWAEGVRNNDVADRRLRIAFSDTFIRMYQSETPRRDAQMWYQRRASFNLLHEWYTRYSPGAEQTSSESLSRTLSQYFDEKEARRAKVRSSIALTLCRFFEMAEQEDFKTDAEVQELFTQIPDRRPTNLSSPWHMLVALAWDRSWEVRAEVALSCVFLARRFPARFEMLIRLMASDWDGFVRQRAAYILWSLCEQNSTNFYLVNDLLDQETDWLDRKISNVDHYLKIEEMGATGLDFPLHLWTGVLATLYIARKNPDVLTIYLHTRLNVPDSFQDRAFRAALEWIFETEYYASPDFVPALKQILLDRTGDNRPSRASEIVEEIYVTRRIALPSFSTSEQKKFDQSRNIPVSV